MNPKPDLSTADLRDADLSGALLESANLRGAQLIGADLHDADLTGADLRMVDGREAHFSRADLSGADLRDADLSGTDLYRAILADCRLVRANLTGSNLQRARLRSTDMEECRLVGVNFSQTVFEKTRLAMVTIDSQTAKQIPKEIRQRFQDSWTIADAPGMEPRILRSLEFPPEYHEAGMSILSYFASVLRDKYPEMQCGVTITQDGHKVTMIIESPGGLQDEIERTLDNYGLVVLGQMTVEDFVDERTQRLRLENQLRIMEVQLETQNQIMEYQRADISWLRSQVALQLAKPPPAIHVNASPSATANAHQFFNLTAHLAPLQDHLAELGRELPDQERQQVESATKDLEQLSSEASPEEAKSRLSRVRKLIEDLGDEKSSLGKTLKGVKRGAEIAQGIARHYNEIAQWCGLS